MKILHFPHPMLLVPCDEVTNFNAGLDGILNGMWKTMTEQKGIGIAANQVGIMLDIIVIEGPKGKVELINPYISTSSVARANLPEGCLSAPGESLIVPGRAQWVQVKYQDRNGEHQSEVFKGIHAVAIQHEIQHIQGEAFFEHPSIPKTVSKRLKKKWGIK
jgi:peptide deformylase